MRSPPSEILCLSDSSRLLYAASQNSFFVTCAGGFLLQGPIMLIMLQDLVRHKWHANAALISAIRKQEAATQDEQLRSLLHHTILANRFWLVLILNRPSGSGRWA